MAGPNITLTRYKIARILEAIEAGNYLETAAQLVGVTAAGLHKWLKLGRDLRQSLEEEVGETVEVDRTVGEAVKTGKDDEEIEDTLAHIREKGKAHKYWLCVELVDGVERAKASSEARAVALISKAAVDHWQAAAWYLERTNYKQWGRKDRVHLSGEDGGPVKVAVERSKMEKTLSELSDEELAGVAKVVESIAATESQQV